MVKLPTVCKLRERQKGKYDVDKYFDREEQFQLPIVQKPFEQSSTTMLGFVNIMKMACLTPTRLVFSKVVQKSLDIVNGPRREDYREDGLVCYDIIMDLKEHITQANGIDMFLKRFRGVKDISVIDEDDVTLYGVNEKHFIFVRTKPGVDLYDMDKHPFFFYIQHESTIEVMTASHETVFRYMRTKAANRNGSNITLLYNIGRCGSTLVTSMVYRARQCVVISEPFAVLDIAARFNELERPVTSECTEYFEMIRTVLLLLAKDPEKLYFMKIHGVATASFLHLVHLALPGTREIFLYRALKPTLTSFKRLFGPGYLWLIADLLLTYYPIKYRKIWEKVGKRGCDKKLLFEIISQMHPFYLEAEHRPEIKSYSYESLLQNKEVFCESLLRDIGIGKEYVSTALLALDKDSQKNSPFSRDRLAGRDGNVSEGTFRWAKKIAKEEFGIEIEGDSYVVQNFPNSWENYL